jgi:hypothetical protein
MKTTGKLTLGIVLALPLVGLDISGCTTPSGPGTEALPVSGPSAGGAATAALSPQTANVPPGRFVFKGVVLVASGPCPGCTLTLKQGSAFVPSGTELVYEAGGALSFAQLNALMRPGLPLHIRGDSDGRTHTADIVLVQAGVHTVGTIDRSSDAVRQSRAFNLTVRSTVIEHAASPNAVIHVFPAGALVDVTADVVEGNRLLAVRIEVH